MTRRKLVTISIVAIVALALFATTAVAQRGGRGDRMGRMQGGGPIFTEEQREEIQEIHKKYDEERVELANRVRVLHMEMAELMSADEPDFDAIETKIEDVHAVKLELAKMRLRIHKEIRPLLSEDQRALFDRGFGMMGHRGMASDARGGRAGGRHMDGRGMRGQCMSGPGMGRQPMGWNAGPGMRWQQVEPMPEDD
jgi:Spy/CpxP family protein refolding chaperone